LDTQASIIDFFTRLTALDIPYFVGGSVASSAHGSPRQTNDVDIVLRMQRKDVDKFASEFERDYMVSRQSIDETLETYEPYRSFQIINFDSLLRVDCFVPLDEPFANSEFERRQLQDVFPGLRVYVAAPEDIVLRKLLWFELGGKVSDRQWNDIVGVLEIQKGRLDETYLDQWADRLKIRDMLDDARSQTID
jgi:hypothetical protein